MLNRMRKAWMVWALFAALGGTGLWADLGKPNLQAICRITLKDGSVLEGAVQVARGGYQRYWDVNGFYITERGEPAPFRSDFRIPILFDLDFKAFEPWTGKRMLADGGVGGVNYQGRQPLVYFLEDLTFQELYIRDTAIGETFDMAS